MGYRDYSVAKGHIVDVTGHGDFTTIAAALTAASSGQTIFIRTGTYTENFTLKAGVDICAFECDAQTPNVTIAGKITISNTGNNTISGINLRTNGDYFLETSGSNSSIIWLKGCYLSCSNNTGIHLTNSNVTIGVLYCFGNISATGISYYNVTAGNLSFLYCNLANSGLSTTATTHSGGNINFQYCDMDFPISTSGTASLVCEHCIFNTIALPAVCLTQGGSGANLFTHCYFTSGTSSSVSISSNAYLVHCTINSSNAFTLTGAGTMNYASIAFTGSSSGHNVTIETALVTI